MLDEIVSNIDMKMKVIDRGKKNKTLNDVKSVENINKNAGSFPEISSLQKEAPLSHKLQDHSYE